MLKPVFRQFRSIFAPIGSETSIVAVQMARHRACDEWWRGLDSNQRTLARADLQSAAFNHSATSPRGHDLVGRRATWRRANDVSTRVTAKSCRAARLTASSGEGNRTSADPSLAWGYAQRTGHVQDDQRLHLASVFDASQRDSRFSWWWRPNSVCCLRRM